MSRKRAILEQVRKRVDAGTIPGLVFSPTYVEGEELSQELSQELGIQVPFVSGKMTKGERSKITEAMRSSPGGCPVAVATAVWTAGLNIPGLRWVIPMEGQAPIRLLQTSGRSMRPKPGGETYEIIDIVDTGASNGTEHAAKRSAHYGEAGVGGEASSLLQRAERRWKSKPRSSKPRSQPGPGHRPSAGIRPSSGPRAQASRPVETQPAPDPDAAGLLWDICVGLPDREEHPVWRLLCIIVVIVAFCASLGKLLE
jgi:superfamily II DNA or RNA helicase